MIRTLTAVMTAAMAISLLISGTAEAQAQSRQNQAGYNAGTQVNAGTQIDRRELEAILVMGNGMNDNGEFRTPISVEAVYGNAVEDGIYAHPMRWDPANSILLTVENGLVTRLDYQITR